MIDLMLFALSYRPMLLDAPLWFVVFLGLWIFLIGGSVGSFMNVVVYRAPLGMSVVYPPSRCPICFNLIHWSDNIPVFSWLRLSGRCRECGTQIPIRYFLVELGVASVFLYVAIVEIFLEGVSLPLGDFARRSSITYPELGAICIIHLVTLATLITATLIVYDRRRIPIHVVFYPMVGILLIAVIWPNATVVPVKLPFEASTSLKGILTSSVGGVIGAAIGCLGSLGLVGANRAIVPWIFALIGVALGWQAVALIGVLSLWLQLVGRLIVGTPDREVPWPVYPLVLVLIHITFWKPIADWLG